MSTLGICFKAFYIIETLYYVEGLTTNYSITLQPIAEEV